MPRRNAAGDVLFDGEFLRGTEAANGDMLVHPTDELTRSDTEVDVDALKKMPTLRALNELFYDWRESGWMWIPPEAFGALTSAPIISEHMTIDDGGKYVPMVTPAYVYAHMRYQVDDPIEEWAAGRVVRFDRGEIEVPPDPKVVEALEKINRHRHLIGQKLLDPVASGWKDEDVLTEARQLKERGLITNPTIDEIKARMLAWR